jgi:3-methyl-2-oxobutanoate hydroxymethyltransferase
VIGDLPYATYDTPEMALASARVLRDAGADCVKFEGAQPDVVAALTEAGHDVCGHLGLESQHQEIKQRQGKTAEAAAKLFDDARDGDAAGQAFLVLELVPRELAAAISRAVRAVTIGIGAGAGTDGQVLVVNDLAGLTPRDFRHNRRYGAVGAALAAAVGAYARDVRAGAFPGPEHGFDMAPAEHDRFLTLLRERGAV